MIKRLQMIMTLVAMCFTVALAPGVASAAATTTNYAILGDSIAFGIGATLWNGYAQQYRDYLKTRYTSLQTNSYAVPGWKTSDMLNDLKTNSSERTYLKNAQETAISIGGNNLLGCASSNYSVIDTVCSEQGTQNFQTDFSAIMKEIRNTIGSSTKLYMLTLYNPYRGDEALYTVADGYIKRINAVINDPANISAYNYRVVDAYSSFAGKAADGTWKVSTYTHFSEPTRDPHPTDAGHKLLKDLHVAKF